jgi:hypothetical protein
LHHLYSRALAGIRAFTTASLDIVRDTKAATAPKKNAGDAARENSDSIPWTSGVTIESKLSMVFLV